MMFQNIAIPKYGCYSGHRYTCECTGWVVPEGGTYTIASTGAVYNAGEQLPCEYETVRYDTYVEGDYRYEVAYDNFNLNRYEWTVYVLDKTKTEYGEIRSSINGRDVMVMNETFKNCTNLTVAPAIPNSITSMDDTFAGCTALTDVSKVVIPSTALYLERCFYNCTSLTTLPNMTMATNMMDISSLFRNCPLATAPDRIPSSVTDLLWAFDGCPFTDSIEIPCTFIGQNTNWDCPVTYYCTVDGASITDASNHTH